MSTAPDPRSAGSPAHLGRASCGVDLRCGDALLRTGSALLDPAAPRYTACARHIGPVPGSGAGARSAFLASRIGPDLARWYVAPGEQARDPATSGRAGFVLARIRARPTSGVPHRWANADGIGRAVVSPVQPLASASIARRAPAGRSQVGGDELARGRRLAASARTR